MWYVLGVLVFLLMGCQSSTVLTAGGYKMIHMNNPECMGLSAAGVLIVQKSDESIITTDITQKTGYCESLSGQVITTSGKVLQGQQIKKGLSNSGTNQRTTTINSKKGGTDPVAPLGSDPS